MSRERSASPFSPLEEKRTEQDRQRQLQVGLAEAFFARGIQNYIGAGWPVNDQDAAAFAQRFYESALGVPDANKPNAGVHVETLGEALKKARERLFRDKRLTWGAYQHYGQAGTRLLARGEGDGET